jgi:hypothetical protein
MYMTVMKCKEDVAGFSKGDLVHVVEIYNDTHVYVYGLIRGSGYIRKDLLEGTTS